MFDTKTGTIGMGGGATAIYPVDGPGGYQIFARTPVPIWDMQQKLGPFKQTPWLLRPTDRMKFVHVTREEFDIQMAVLERTRAQLAALVHAERLRREALEDYWRIVLADGTTCCRTMRACPISDSEDRAAEAAAGSVGR